MDFHIKKHTLRFKFNAGTSRGVLTEKDTWLLKVFDGNRPEVFGIGECSPLKGLSTDYSTDYEQKLISICRNIFAEGNRRPDISEVLERVPAELPSIRFGIETAVLDLLNDGKRKIFDCDFYDRQMPVPINGLVWMGEKEFMLRQINEKIEGGFDTIKIKVGAIDHDAELGLLKFIRSRFGKEDIAIRLDANGAFDGKNVFVALSDFARFDVHSIEQPVKQGQIELMRKVCAASPVPVALDEELIGVYAEGEQAQLLDEIAPQYIILKPSLIGGLAAAEQWIKVAEHKGIGWWMTSLLESNVGLNAIAQFTSKMKVKTPQGLGTGQLYHNNITSPLKVQNGALAYDQNLMWELGNG